MYNVKVIHYESGDQIRLYDKKLFDKDDLLSIEMLRSNNNIKNDDELKEETYNPFTEKKEYIENIKEYNKEHSIRSSYSRTIQKIYSIVRSNIWDYFITLTFDPKIVDSFDYDIVTKKLSYWLKNIKKTYAKNLKYIIVPEKHKSGRYHFHGLFSDCGDLKFIDSGYRDKGNIIYNLDNYKLGFTTATKVLDTSKVGSYITKYITKDLCRSTFGSKRYWSSRNLNVAEVEEFNISSDDMETLKILFLDNFNDNVKYRKTVDSGYVNVDYLEIDCNVKDLIPDMCISPK